MGNQVKVTSFDALESFRASLIVFLTKSRRAVDDVSDEVRRTRSWLQHDRRLHWEGAVRHWEKVLDQAQQELMSARMSGARKTTESQQAAVTKAKRSLTEAEEKLRAVKKWNRDFDSSSEPLVKRLGGLREFLEHDMPKGVTYIAQALKTLEAYAERMSTDEPETVSPTQPEIPQ